MHYLCSGPCLIYLYVYYVQYSLVNSCTAWSGMYLHIPLHFNAQVIYHVVKDHEIAR